jgi:hypothetical protein
MYPMMNPDEFKQSIKKIVSEKIRTASIKVQENCSRWCSIFTDYNYESRFHNDCLRSMCYTGSCSCCLSGLALIAKGVVNKQYNIRDGKIIDHNADFRNTSMVFSGLLCFLGMLVCVDTAVFFEDRMHERHEHV